jgi:hypothetical protein
MALPQPTAISKGVRDDRRVCGRWGMETCATLGMLTGRRRRRAEADAGLDYYNHNLDTSPEFYGEIITTREYQDRLDTLEHVRDAGMKTCCGGIVGMGETRGRAGLLAGAGQPARASRKGADQPPGAGRRHAAAGTEPSWIPSSSCAPSPWPAS